MYRLISMLYFLLIKWKIVNTYSISVHEGITTKIIVMEVYTTKTCIMSLYIL
jgi:hypothetical protein